MPATLAKLAKDIGKFINAEYSGFVVKLTINSIKEMEKNIDEINDEDIEKIMEQVNKSFEETYLKTKTTPRKSTPKKEKEPALTYDEYIEKYENNDKVKGCQWPITRGADKGKVCGVPIPVDEDDGYTLDSYKNRRMRCKACERNVGDKPFKKSLDWFNEHATGNQVKGTPTSGHSVPENYAPVSSISGVKEGVVSPTPENFVAGQNTGNETPTKAKKKKSSPEKFKVKNIKHGKKVESYSDFKSSSPYNGSIILLRVHNDDGGRKTFGGKFSDLDDIDSELYLQGVIPLTEKDLEDLKKYEYEYEYCGQSKEENIEDLLDQLSGDESD